MAVGETLARISLLGTWVGASCAGLLGLRWGARTAGVCTLLAAVTLGVASVGLFANRENYLAVSGILTSACMLTVGTGLVFLIPE